MKTENGSHKITGSFHLRTIKFLSDLFKSKSNQTGLFYKIYFPITKTQLQFIHNSNSEVTNLWGANLLSKYQKNHICVKNISTGGRSNIKERGDNFLIGKGGDGSKSLETTVITIQTEINGKRLGS